MDTTASRSKGVNLSANSLKVLERRYLKKDENGNVAETPEEMFRRVANTIASADKFYGKTDGEVKSSEERFCEMMMSLEFLPNSPTLMNAGRDLGQLSACFVLPIADSMESIFEAIKNTALIHRSGGGTGFSFSRLRPKNSMVKTTGGIASGPVSFMKVFDAATHAVKQGGTRRGANMGILRVDHPDILEFISCKESDKDITNFNISVALTDAFMEHLEKDEDYDLIDPHTGKGGMKLSAKKVFDLIVEKAWRNGEPGIIFIDRINETNPTPKAGVIESTNPCIVGDSLVSTEHGLMRMKDIAEYFKEGGLQVATDDRVAEVLYSQEKEGDVALKIKSGITFSSISQALYSGRKPVLKLTTESGYELLATADHKIMTTEGWVAMGCLRKGDHRILIQSGEGKFNEDKNLPFVVVNHFIGENGRRYKLNLPSEWSKELGQALGWLVGDGWLRDQDENRRAGFTFSKEDAPILDYFKPILNDWYGYDVQEVERENGVTHLSYHSKYLVDFFKSLGMKAWQSGEKDVPEAIYTAPKETVIGFLQGLFTADGTVGLQEQNNSTYIRLTAKSLKLLKGVQRLLVNLGIFSRIFDRSRPKRFGFPYKDIRGNEKVYVLDGICYELHISRDNIGRFLERIGFLCGKHKKKTDILLKRNFYSCEFENGIAKIEDAGKMDVYDLSEPRSNSFISNGLCVKNCGEQPLLPYESCNLGSINLSAFVIDKGEGGPAGPVLDWGRLKIAVADAVHFLDNVIDMNKFPLPEIEKNTKANRKIGLGVMGWAECLIGLNIPYGSDEAVALASNVMKFVSDEARDASQGLAKERGAFPNFEGSVYDVDGQLPLRNATLTTIAPTGTISIIANCSSGIEPLFSISYFRNVMDNDKLVEVSPLFEEVAKKRGFYSKELMEKIAKEGSIADMVEVPEDVRKVFTTAHDIVPDCHIKMQAIFQRYTDNAVSKTVNFPHEASGDEVRHVYMLAYRLGCKGVTVYRDGSREEQVLNIARDLGKPKQEIVKVAPRPRPKVTRGTTTKIGTGCGSLYVTINEDDEGKPFEIFTQMGKSGGCAASQLESLARLVSLALRSGIEVHSIMDQLRGIRCPAPAWEKGGRIFSCADAIARVIEQRIGAAPFGDAVAAASPAHDENHHAPHTMLEDAVKLEPEGTDAVGDIVGVCPDCGAALRHEEGCIICKACGYSKC